jgi:ABC-2 type transport system permease protein
LTTNRRLVASFVRRDFDLARATRLVFVLDAAAAAFSMVTFSLVSKLVEPGEVPGGYFAFAAVGLVISTILQAGVVVVANNFRQEQIQGTLESILPAGCSTGVLAFGMSSFPLLAAVFRGLIYGVLAALLGARAPGANWALGVLAIILGTLSFAGIAIVGGALVLVLRQAVTATGWIIAVLSLTAGVLFPPSFLPAWVLRLAQLSPLTQSLELARAAILEGASWSSSWDTLGILCLMVIAYGGLGVATLATGLRRARQGGSLSQF